MPRLCWGRMTAHGRVDPPERDGSLAAGRPLLGSCRCYWRAVRTLAGRAPGRLVRKGGDVQAASLQQTAASMEEISGTVAQTTDTAQLMAHESDQSGQGAGRSGAAIPSGRSHGAHPRLLAPHGRDHRRDRKHCLPGQPAGPECRRRSSTRRWLGFSNLPVHHRPSQPAKPACACRKRFRQDRFRRPPRSAKAASTLASSLCATPSPSAPRPCEIQQPETI